MKKRIRKLTFIMAISILLLVLVSCQTARAATSTDALNAAAQAETAMGPGIVSTAIETMAGVVQIALAGLLGLLFSWIKKKTKSDELKSSIDLLEQAAVTTVGELQQTLVNGWKEANADGKLTDEEIRDLKRRSLSLVKKRLGTATQNVISAAGIDLEDRITAAIQSAITAMKNASVVVMDTAALEVING